MDSFRGNSPSRLFSPQPIGNPWSAGQCSTMLRIVGRRGSLKLRGVAFDLDGVLVDSEIHKAASHVGVISTFGGRIAVDDYATVLGESAPYVASRMMEIAGLNRPVDEYLARFEGDYAKRLNAIPGRDGAVNLLAVLAARGVKIGVVTSSTRPVLDDLLRRCELARYVSARVAADDVGHPKPAPDCYLNVMEQLQVGAAEIAVVEDTEVGVSAAKAAGAGVVAVRHRLNHNMKFEDAYAVVEGFESPERLLILLEGCTTTI
jgi:HAD superfamily hydrolase (TIGR01509 family)